MAQEPACDPSARSHPESVHVAREHVRVPGVRATRERARNLSARVRSGQHPPLPHRPGRSLCMHRFQG